MNSDLLLIFSFAFPFLFAAGASETAKKKNRKQWIWFINGLSLGIIGLIIVGLSRTLDFNDELDYPEECDTLGWTTLFISVVWFGITFYIGYNYTKSYLDMQMLDSMLQLIR